MVLDHNNIENEQHQHDAISPIYQMQNLLLILKGSIDSLFACNVILL